MGAEFLLLGPVEMRAGGRSVPVGGQLSRCVLAVLLLEANRAVSIEQIVEATWGAQPPASARVQVQNRVSALRRVLPEPFIATQGSGYVFRLEEDQLDSARFLRAIERAAEHSAAGDHAAARDELQAALGLWRGPALDGLTTPYFQAAAQHLEEQRLRVLEQRLRLDLLMRRHHEVIPEVSALVAKHPFRESLHAMLMLALFQAGRQADALEAFRGARSTLAEHLGLEPGAVLQRLHMAVLRGEASLDDLDRAEPAAQNLSLVPVPHELPADIPRFTGRAQVLKTLSQRHDSVVAITGSAGVGKTALAVHWAHRAAERFPDGQLYLNLRGYSAGEPVRPIVALGQLLRSLGVPPAQVPVDEDAAAALFRSTVAGRKILVLLDNASGSDQVRPLLPGTPGTLVIVTSRDRLTGLAAREDALCLPVDVLLPEESLALLTRLLGQERVAADPPAAAELTALCAHLPLALRVTAANLSVRPLRTLAEHAAALRGGDLLTALAADGDEQAAVRAAFDLSYQAIAPSAQRVFQLFGLVPGADLTAAAVAAAAARITPGEADRQLQRLAAEHLVQEHAPGRYSTHDLLRAYAREHAANDPDSSAALTRLFEWYLHAADAADRRLYPERARSPLPDAPALVLPHWDDASAASAWFDDERLNLVAAVHHAAEHGPDAYAWQIAETLGGYFYLSRHLIDWFSSMDAGLAAAERDEATMSQSVINLSLAVAHRLMGDNAAGVDHAERASALARKAGWAKGEAVAHSVIASVRWQAGQLRLAVTELHHCLHVYREIGESAGQAINLSNLGVLHGELGDLPQAIEAATHALALLTPDDHVTAARFRASLGNYLLQSGQYARAETELQASLALSRQVGDRGNTADTLSFLAEASLHLGRPDDALALAREAVEIFDEIRYPRGQATGSDTLGRIHRGLGRPREAIVHHERARRIAADHDFRYPQVQALTGLAEAYACLGQHEVAAEHARLALRRAAQAEFRLLEARARAVLESA